MNQWDYLNQRADELERALNAGRRNVKSLYDPQRPTLYEIQQQNADDVRKLLEQYEADLKEQAKESKRNRKLTIISIIVGIVAAVFGGASFVVALITLLLQLS
nr:MAG TPA: coiled-coil domain-containing protein [Caudoviricetes sp.]